MPKLTIEEGGRSTVYEILDDAVLVGRREGAAIRLSDPDAGPEHCQIRLVPGVGWKLIDLESRNGTKVNGSFVNQHVLREGDRILVGSATLTFSGAGPVPPAVAPAPVAAPAPPPMAWPAPAPPPVSGPARPAPREDREPRVRRPRRGNRDTPVIVAAVAAGSVLLLVVFLWLGSAWFRMSPNMQIYGEMLELLKKERYEEAVAIAEKADPNGDAKGWTKVQAEKKNAQEAIKSRDAIRVSRDQAFPEYSAIESWIQDHRSDVGGAIQRWEAFASKWDGKSVWAGQARQNARNLRGPGSVAPAGGGGSVPAANPLESDWEITLGTTRFLRQKDRYQDAIDMVYKFWDENQLKTGTAHSAWKGKVDAEVRSIEDAAAARYNELEARVRKYRAEGKFEQAIAILKDIAQSFGIEKYTQMAVEQLRVIQRD